MVVVLKSIVALSCLMRGCVTGGWDDRVCDEKEFDERVCDERECNVWVCDVRVG